MRDQKVIVIGASAGGLEAASTVLRDLSPRVTAPIFVVIHTAPDSPSLLPEILSRVSGRKAKHAEDGEKYRANTVYVAPPDRHLTLERDGTMRVVRGPRENRHRPAVDPLFRSAALASGAGAIAIILSGTLDDGTAGMIAVRERGGLTIVQDPDDALYPGMPKSAIEHAPIEHVLPASQIAAAIGRAVVEPRPTMATPRNASEQMEMEKRTADMDPEAMATDARPGTPSPYSCPECGGVLWQIEEGEFVRYRCRVGHAYSPENVFGAQAERYEEALWTALKTLDETARLSKKLADNERARGHDWMVSRFEERERDARQKADLIRQLIEASDADVPSQALPRADQKR